jgi:hypothetical protein
LTLLRNVPAPGRCRCHDLPRRHGLGRLRGWLAHRRHRRARSSARACCIIPMWRNSPSPGHLSGVDIAQDVAEIVVRTRTNVTGWAEEVSAIQSRSPTGSERPHPRRILAHFPVDSRGFPQPLSTGARPCTSPIEPAGESPSPTKNPLQPLPRHGRRALRHLRRCRKGSQGRDRPGASIRIRPVRRVPGAQDRPLPDLRRRTVRLRSSGA